MNKIQVVHAVHRKIENYYRLLKSLKKLPYDQVITTSAQIADHFVVCMADHRGALHQHFFINIDQVTEGNKNVIEGKPTFVAVRYGDKSGLEEPVPGLETGKPIIIKGVYIPSSQAYKSDDNPGLPVLHFTHRPLGFILYNGIKYE